MDNNQFYIYNTHLNQKLNTGDAIKVTSYPQCESFWVSIEKIIYYNNKTLYECKVQNSLIRKHNYNYLDIIYINSKKYIKDFKIEEQRFHLNTIDQEYINNKCFDFILENKRLPTILEFESIINTK